MISHQDFENCWRQESKRKTDDSIHSNRYSNRYYDRGSGFPNTCCTQHLLEENKRKSSRVVSHGNPYAENFPSNPQYSVFSIFGDDQLTMHDLKNALRYYNQLNKDSEELYGPFDQTNLNKVGEIAYSNSSHPLNSSSDLYKISEKGAIFFLNAFNQSFYHLKVKGNLFSLQKIKIVSIRRSSQTGYLKYQIIVSLIKVATRLSNEFEFVFYFHPETLKIILGKAFYLGNSTTDKLFLLNGIDSFLGTGRPLHPLLAKDSEMISLPKAHELYKQKMKKKDVKSYFTQEIPFWIREKQSHL
jgi:hypothetical protein